MKNPEIAKVLYDVADILEIQGVQFKPNAYRKAARGVESLSREISDIYEEEGPKGLRKIPGVGESIAEKIEEMVKTGNLKYCDELKKAIPKNLSELIEIPGMGPKRAKLLHEKLRISSVEDLETAIKRQKIRKLRGFGEKSETDLLKGIELLKKGHERMLLGNALPMARLVESRLKELKEAYKVSIAGSLRRRNETIGDVDILVAAGKPRVIMNFFTTMPDVERVIAKGPTKSAVLLSNGIQADLRVVEDNSFGAALQYFTGNKEHNIKLRGMASKKGLKISEYGVFNKKTCKRIAGRSENEVYGELGLPYIEPELRENQGEIEAALEGKLPKIINYNDIKGDLHVHTRHSDGANTIEEMALAAQGMGYEYICIADHTKSQRIARGQTEEQVLKEIEEIRALNKRMRIRILAGAEVDIKANGELDLDDSVLKKLDIASISVHSRFKSSREEMTERILKAMENEHVDILNHPTGRLISRRAPYEVDLQRIFKKAADRNIFLEVNSFPDRLDLKDVHVKAAIEAGAHLVISTDSHNKEHLRYIEYGIATARRGWAEKKDVINTKPLKKLPEYFRKIRS